MAIIPAPALAKASSPMHPARLPAGLGLTGDLSGISGITCPSRTRCLAAGNGTKGAVVLRSTNGGASWSQVTLPAGLGLVGHYVLLNQLSCSTVAKCLATGLAGIGPAVLLGSSNGGASWSRVTLPRGQGLVDHPAGFVSTISCPSRTQCLAGLSLDTKGAMIDLISMRNLAQGSTVVTPRDIDVAVVLVLVVMSVFLVRRRHVTATRPAPDAVSVDTTR
ncbi:hypothetical protein [Ferrimicrobium sp.]|uniref:WD40/YVTN/BNR-like repeat-containing protein n=1 Tax=Ferrimicrobium sp. TaxID=2926050 RepID=UPI00262302C4|nr:hypothetical protein [Ferrimicrobium sp.]